MSSGGLFGGGGFGSAKQPSNESSGSSPKPQSNSRSTPPAKPVVPAFGGNNHASNQPSLFDTNNQSSSPQDKPNPTSPVNTAPPGNSFGDVLFTSYIKSITSPPASSTSNESFFSETLADASPKKKSKSQHLSPRIPIDGNVFYNEETLKYMRIIDMYKKLGVGKDIELPRVKTPLYCLCAPHSHFTAGHCWSPIVRQVKFTREPYWSSCTNHNWHWNPVPHRDHPHRRRQEIPDQAKHCPRSESSSSVIDGYGKNAEVQFGTSVQ